MKLWLLSILLILSAVAGITNVYGDVSADCPKGVSIAILPEVPAENTVASMPYSYLQDMIQPEGISQVNCFWKRLIQHHAVSCAFLNPAIFLSTVFFPRYRQGNDVSLHGLLSLFLSFPIRAGPTRIC